MATVREESRVELDGKADVLAFYGAAPEVISADPVIFLRGDVVEKRDTGIVVSEGYTATTAYGVQAVAEQLCASFARPYVHLARPGILGSCRSTSRPATAARSSSCARHGAHSAQASISAGSRLNLVGESGGGHAGQAVALVCPPQPTIGCAVIASAKTAVARESRERWTTRHTGQPTSWTRSICCRGAAPRRKSSSRPPARRGRRVGPTAI